MDEAQKGRPWLLMPPNVDARKYPLPSSVDELLRVGLLPAKHGGDNAGSVYIRRCQRAYKAKVRNRIAPNLLTEAARDKARKATFAHKEDLKAQKAEAEALMEGLRTTVATATASLTSLYDLVKKGDEMILKGFVSNSEVNGQKVDIASFQRTSAGVKAHVAKIGMPTDDESKAEDAIFADYEAAIEATRAGIDATVAGVTTH